MNNDELEMPQGLQETLKGSDEELFTKGACHIFADELFKRLGPLGFKMRRVERISDILPNWAFHVYVANAGQMFDVFGSKSEDEYIAKLRKEAKADWKFEPYDVCFADLVVPQSSSDDDQKGLRSSCRLAIDTRFVAECRRRAQDRMNNYQRLYVP